MNSVGKKSHYVNTHTVLRVKSCVVWKWSCFSDSQYGECNHHINLSYALKMWIHQSVAADAALEVSPRNLSEDLIRESLLSARADQGGERRTWTWPQKWEDLESKVQNRVVFFPDIFQQSPMISQKMIPLFLDLGMDESIHVAVTTRIITLSPLHEVLTPTSEGRSGEISVFWGVALYGGSFSGAEIMKLIFKCFQFVVKSANVVICHH